MLGTLDDSTILRLRVKGSNLDPLALRGRLENVLSEVSLQPRLPPTATLFIRKLNDPLPGLLQLDSPHARAPHAWRDAFQTRFDQLVSSAARPAYGFVADSAESVVFYDYAELLASLTADWCSGFAMTRWWWQALIKHGDVAQMIRQFWREKIEYVPAALEYLVRRGVVVEFVSRISQIEARELVKRVVQVFGLRPLIKLIRATDFPSSAVSTPEDHVTHVAHLAQVRSEMPWRHVAPESDTPRLRPAQQLFVGIALMIQRAPARVRTLSFAREVERWLERVGELADAPELVTEQIIEPAIPDASESRAPIRVDQVDAAPEVATPDSPEAQKSVASVAEIDIPEVQEPSGERIVHTPPTGDIKTTAPLETFVSATNPVEAHTIETELGGIFYLINVAIFMEIYSDFTSPVEQLHDDLNIWDFVAIVAQELDDHERDDDPIWQLLESLSGREEKAELETIPTWLTDLLPHLRTRLNLAFGIDDDAKLANILLHHHAKINVTATHLDVFFSLADHPIEIRLSGLDRNPGWVPAAGRFIAFHYD